jgi:hypothetical protein
MLRKLTLLLLIVCTLTYAKDKKEDNPKPVRTGDQKVEVFKNQRDYIDAIRQALPYNINAQTREKVLNDSIAKYSEGVDLTKWKLNFDNLDFEPIPPKPEEKHEEVKPTPAPIDKP